MKRVMIKTKTGVTTAVDESMLPSFIGKGWEKVPTEIKAPTGAKIKESK